MALEERISSSCVVRLMMCVEGQSGGEAEVQVEVFIG
jgi:hypothetical protein